MSYITPRTNIYLYSNCPLPSNYEHTFYFDNLQAQTDYFSGLSRTPYNNNTYQVMSSGVIRIKDSIDNLYNKSYMSFVNTKTNGIGFENKTYYCFVTDVIYINNGTTEIHYTIDVMQTYLFQYKSGTDLGKKMFVERNHIPKSEDNLTHDCMMNDEGLDVGLEMRPTIKSSATPFAINSLTAFVFYTGSLVSISDTANIIPNNLQPTEVDLYEDDKPSYKAIAVKTPNNNAYIYNSEMLGNGYYIKDRGLINPLNIAEFIVYDSSGNPVEGRETGGSNVGEGYLGLQCFVAVLNALGKSDAIVKIVMMPSAIDNKNTRQSNILINKNAEYEQTIKSDATFGTYTPKNYKLYGYPYNYIVVDNNENESKTFIPQFVNDDIVNTGIKFKFMTSVLNGIVHIYPTNYITNEVTYGLSKEIGVECPFITSAYKDWLANSTISRNLAINNHIATSALSIASGIVGGSSDIKTGDFENTLVDSKGKVAGYSGNFIESPTGSLLQSGGGLGTRAITSTANAISNSASFITSLVQQKAEHAEIPNSFVGTLGGNMSYITDRLGFKITRMRVTAGVAKRIDDYFSVYGYKIMDWKTPKLKVRSNWTFIKTAGCAIKSTNIPTQFEDAINKIFDNGITFWANTSNFMNYGDFSNPDPS